MHESAWAAEPHDVDRIVELAAELRAELVGERGGRVWELADTQPVDPERVHRWLADPTTHVVVGGIDGVALGFAVVHTVAMRDDTRLGVIDELYVEPGAREVGVGEEVLRHGGAVVPGGRLLRRRCERTARPARHQELLRRQRLHGPPPHHHRSLTGDITGDDG